MLILLISSIYCHKCIHDEKYKDFAPAMATQRRPQAYSTRTLRDEDWKPIRIKFVTDWIDGTRDDKYMCKTVGQEITLNRRTYTCEQDDLLTEAKLKSIQGTLKNLQDFLARLVKVIPNTEKIIMSYNQVNDFESGPDYEVTGCDMGVFVTVRTFGQGSTLASAVGFNFDNYQRPRTAYIDINARKIPAQPASENDWDNEFFYTLIHEMFHGLGVSRSRWQDYHPYNTNQPHKQIKCQLTKYNKEFDFLVTPYAHIYAKKRFGVDKFVGDDNKECPAGIEIEDGSSAGGSHLEARTYVSEMMIGTTISQRSGPYSRLTDASMALLLDTGNYKVNWSMGQPLIWGNPESINGKPIENFALGPPQLTYPEGYVYIHDNYPSFDYKTWGGSTYLWTDSEAGQHCDPGTIFGVYCGPARYTFYNPKKRYIVQDLVFDFMPLVFPQYTCPKGKAVFVGKDQSINTRCVEYKCDWYDSYTLKFENTTVNCTSETIDQKFPYWQGTRKLQVTCADPQRVCRTMALYDMHFVKDPFDPNTKQLPQKPQPGKPSGDGNDDTTTKTGGGEEGTTHDNDDPTAQDDADKKKRQKIIIAVSSAVAALVVIAIIVIVVIFVFKHAANKPDSGSGEEVYV